MNCHPPETWTARLSIARSIASDGGRLEDVAAAWDCSKPNVVQCLSRHAPEVRRQLRDNRVSPNILDRPSIIRRLRLVLEYGINEAARREGVAASAMSTWIKRHAGGVCGVADALADWADEEEVCGYELA